MSEKRHNLRTRTSVLGIMVLALMMVSGTAVAHTTELEAEPGIWLSDPEGVDGDNGIEQGDLVEGARGSATITNNGTRFRIKATGLEPGHVYTIWTVYFNDSTLCDGSCTGADFATAGGGVLWGAGRIAGADGQATFIVNLRTGDGAGYVGSPPPPPFALAAYEAGPDNEFHVVIKSHGPMIEGLVHDQLSSYGGGCEVNVGPSPGQVGDFPVPAAPGECGEIQLYVFG